ncbi:MAG: hypothetical protein V4521_12090, partial [Pseudomonadota bacterium]
MKKILPDGSIIEGTPEEIAHYEAFQRLHGNASANAGSVANAVTETDVDWEYVSGDVAFRALTRIKLGKETKAVLSR